MLEKNHQNGRFGKIAQYFVVHGFGFFFIFNQTKRADEKM